MHYSSCKIRTSYAQRVPVVSSHSVVLTWMGAPVPSGMPREDSALETKPRYCPVLEGLHFDFYFGKMSSFA